ncbi:hypothetical protein ACIQK9_10605 [Streptomyces hydrogenans]|uniref:hypothetical protein n=1 Tax=Streptomyces hydrogenans TaxID=1873719 RepID=UPI00382C8B7D
MTRNVTAARITTGIVSAFPSTRTTLLTGSRRAAVTAVARGDRREHSEAGQRGEPHSGHRAQEEHGEDEPASEAAQARGVRGGLEQQHGRQGADAPGVQIGGEDGRRHLAR